MNINVRVIHRTNISLSIKDFMHFERHDTYGQFFEVTSSQRLNSNKVVVNSARFVATSFGVLTFTLMWLRRVHQWRNFPLCPLDGRR